MSINKLISIKNPIINAMDLLNVDHSQNNPVFTTWATDAEKKIGSYYQFVKKRAVLDIKNCIAELPCDARYIQRAILGDLGCDCADLFALTCSLIPMSSTVLNASPSLNSFLIVDMGTGYREITGSIPHVVQDNKIILNQNLDGQKLTIQYLAYSTDCDGFMEIGENHVDAIKWYIVWLYWYRKRNLSPMEQGKMNTAQREWHRECAHARATDGELTESERNEMVKILHDPLAGPGLDLGMHTTLGIGFW